MSRSEFKGLTVGFIGAGTMGGAIIHALVAGDVVSADQIIASEPMERRRREVAQADSIQLVDDNPLVASKADVLVLSIKPQVLPRVMPDLRGRVRPSAFVFSIVAGTPMSAIREAIQHAAVVRTMPNTPAQIGEGMTVWTASPEVTDAQRAQARLIVQAMGVEMYVDHEDALDMATAVSGTGPVYVFLLMEALVDAAVHLGFSRPQARTLVIQTVLGSAEFAQQSDLHLAQMRNMVTSPAGASAEAIYQMEKGGLRTTLAEAVWAAYEKSVSLGQRAQAAADGPPKIEGG